MKHPVILTQRNVIQVRIEKIEGFLQFKNPPIFFIHYTNYKVAERRQKLGTNPSNGVIVLQNWLETLILNLYLNSFAIQRHAEECCIKVVLKSDPSGPQSVLS